MRTILLLGAASSLAVLGCGGPPAVDMAPASLDVERVQFTDLDRDDDDRLDREELHGATTLYYDAIDSDQDGRLSDRELADGLFLVWDRDHDNRLSQTELERGAVAWFPNDVDATVRGWDENDDLEIDRAEFHRGLERERVFAAWDGDGDGRVTDLELTGAVFETWDIDRSDSIDALEWRFE